MSYWDQKDWSSQQIINSVSWSCSAAHWRLGAFSLRSVKRSQRITYRCNRVCFNYMGISCSPVSHRVLQPKRRDSEWTLSKHADHHISSGIKVKSVLCCSQQPFAPRALLRVTSPDGDAVSSRSNQLTNISSLVCSLLSSWQSMYPQAKPNKLISQSPLYTLPPTKRLMARAYNPSQNNYRDANCISL